jgi:hypothetical protein
VAPFETNPRLRRLILNGQNDCRVNARMREWGMCDKCTLMTGSDTIGALPLGSPTSALLTGSSEEDGASSRAAIRPPQLAALFISVWQRWQYTEQLMGLFRRHLRSQRFFLSQGEAAFPGFNQGKAANVTRRSE